MNLRMRIPIIFLPILIVFSSCSELHEPSVQDNMPKNGSAMLSPAGGELPAGPVRVNNYDILFNGKTYDEAREQSTFSYTVTGTGVEPALNSLFIEVPSCAGNPVAFLPVQSAKLSEQGIEWEASIPTSSSAGYSITFNGDLQVGLVDATVESGNSTATEQIPGPCKGIYTISGSVFVDANSSQQKESNESGIQNVTVTLTGNNVELTQQTSQTGSYVFSVLTGDNTVDFTLKVLNEMENSTDFNEQLFDSHTATTNPPEETVTVSNADISNINFGFSPQTQKLIQQFGDGTIILNTEEPKFWIRQLRAAKNNNRTADVTADELLAYLNEIESLLLTVPFQFGAEKFDAALDIMTRPIKTDLEALLVELLAAELNVVSGRGSGSIEFDLALIAFGESAANEAINPINNLTTQTQQASSNVVETETTSFSSLLNDAESLLSSYNRSGSGGGVGNN